MKKIYFGNGVSREVRSIVKFTSSMAYRIAPSITKRTSYHLLTNPYGSRQVTFDSLTPSEEFKVKTKLGMVNVYKFSGGEKHIVLIHGWADTVKCFMKIIMRLLQEGYTVWTFDQIGHGKSDGKRSHLFGFIDGLRAVIQEIEDRGHSIDSLVAHSMGGASVLNLDHSFLLQKRIVLIAMPAQFFENMFEKINDLGISKNILSSVLDDVSLRYNTRWRDLHPDVHKDKVGENVFFIHDTNDRFCEYSHIKHYTQDVGANLLSTTGLGHRRILRDNNVIREVLSFIGEGIE